MVNIKKRIPEKNMKVMTCLVHFNMDEWTKFTLYSFLKYTNLPILVVDNSPTENFKNLMSANNRIISIVNNDKNNKLHGAGIDLAVDWCKKHNYTHLVHIEHDCIIAGMVWYKSLCGKAKAGYAHVYSFRQPFGAHPTPSIWKINEITNSFLSCKKGMDKDEELYKSLNIKYNMDKDIAQMEMWDTGIKNWYEMERKHQSIQIRNQPDFIHCWVQSYSAKIELSERSNWNKILKDYLNNVH